MDWCCPSNEVENSSLYLCVFGLSNNKLYKFESLSNVESI